MSGELRGVDLGFDGHQFHIFRTTTVNTSNTHGTGCTLSAAIVANLCLKKDIFLAVQQSKLYVTSALEHSLTIGKGQWPVGHFYPLLSRSSNIGNQDEKNP